MELQDYLGVVRKRWATIAVLTLLCALASVVFSLTRTPMYSATTQLFVSVQGSMSSNDLLQGANFTRQQVASYRELVTSPLVLAPVVDDLALAQRTEDLAARVSAEAPVNTSLINISVYDEDGALAAAKANAIANEFREVVSELETPDGAEASQVKISIVREATVPTGPASPNTRLDLGIGLALGLVLGLAVALLREVLDTRVRGEDDVARVTDSSVVGAIVYDEDAPKAPLIVQSDPHSPRAEAFRRLRTNVQFLEIADRPHSIIVTSSVPAEGKSTTAINLAIALADSGTRVALVDADLRRPAVGRYMGLESAAGLTTVLIGRATLDDVVQPWGNGFLHVLPSGQIPPNPSELLGSAAMAQVLRDLTARYDMVLVDTPPLLPVTDAAILAKFTGGALVVVGAGTVHRGQLAESIKALETVGARVLGLVLNREARKASKSYEYYRYESAPAAPSRGAARFWRRRGGSVSAPVPTAQTPTVAPASAVDDAVLAGAGQSARLWPGETFTESQLRGQQAALPPQHRR
ncbi:polysaccharide biosynthesis tyrosine autokinase [Cellulomonas sp. JZ18]|uniref:polysaccharide biosynthesis tyrosine autokinase n=1 Tax=Cellulomonas sp. JZ18 TaxID=2654191 RepID=UPI0012D3F3AB|nr:polysaccharide biosynthesis tyrosine autokinase [Cellulomonas sp. JZ18]QGQ20265.1 polysaccharide biosynthesis tyrosine autokinase [Cellulomonas sp. JZ18]